ncbi:MAG: heparinase II/III domain-containing protein, partial [Planctomycetota bacterium]
MPDRERTRIRQLIATREWAKADYTRIKEAARKGDGFVAAFLYALDGDPAYVPTARKWLLRKFGANAGTTRRARGALDNPEFFKAGVPHLSDVFYDTDFRPYLGFDWVYKGLIPAARREIQQGISAFMHFKMRCMDRWTQTPNLVFKPTCIVAFAGLAVQERELIDWGFHRKPGSRIGGYLPVLNNVLKDGGPWHEAPIYPIAHTDLYCMGIVSRYRALYDGKDWWTAKAPNGGSPKGLMNYYIDTAYPIERTGHGRGQIRVATYGDGATNAKHDLFLVNPAGAALDCTKALIAAYNASGDPRLAPFVAMVPDYKPTLVDRPPLPEKVTFPPVSSKIWPDFGLAVLRAEESPAYWTSDAPVVFQLTTNGYGHDHSDKFSIIFHGAGRLLYPDYNAIQYENANIGWTRNTIAHNTLMVDEGDTRSAGPSGVRHAFTPEVKYLATSASGVFEKVDQTRALLLTREYLLDVFHAASPTPRVYDYLLHSFGTPRPAQPELFRPSNALDKRFWLASDRRAMTTDKLWALDFVIKEKPGSRKGKLGPEWYSHTAAVRVTMAGEPKTLVTHGISGVELGRSVKRTFDPLGMLIARRAGVRQTVFVATHEPYANAAKPGVAAVTKLAQSDRAMLVRVDAADYTDYAAISFGPQAGTTEHALAAANDPKTGVAFRDYGYLRMRRDGTVAARGGWIGFRIPAAKAALTLNGRPARAVMESGRLVFGALPEAHTAHVEPECPFPVDPDTAVVRLAREGRRAVTFTVKNTLPRSITGALAFELPAGITVDPPTPRFGPLAPGATAQVPFTCIAGRNAAQGKWLVPYRVRYRTADAAREIRPAALPFHLAVDSVLEYVYRYPQRNVFRVSAPRYIAEMDMDSGLTRFLADDDGAVRLNGTPLFTFSDGKKPWLFDGCTNNYTWPSSVPAALTGAPSAYGTCRYRMSFKPGRITVRMDPGWTRFDPT